MPLTFPGHQGLILPVVRRWPGAFDALALSVGAAMPDIADSVLGFSLNGYFKQWYGHALVGIFTLDLAGGLLITWLLAAGATRFLAGRSLPERWQRFLPGPRPDQAPTQEDPVLPRRSRSRVWSFSVLVGILSHIGIDLISHDTNLLFYPWWENPHWLPDWWYVSWFQVRPLAMFGRSYSFGVFSILWGLLSALGVFLFFQFLYAKREK